MHRPCTRWESLTAVSAIVLGIQFVEKLAGGRHQLVEMRVVAVCPQLLCSFQNKFADFHY